ncbi:MAG TPA: peroxiredoxin [Candidatus Binatia bacterium]|nr:peroxiredoxin [Candidatus Binatia bacterium]
MSLSKLFYRFVALTIACVAALSGTAVASLKQGDSAPAFRAKASIGGRVFEFDLTEALKKGPVVLYFYPAAFTPGCTVEAHDFAEHMDDFHRLGATVIGVSSDDIERLSKFSVSECRSKFAVAADESQSIAKEYGATLIGKYDNRTSYVIARDGKIAYEYTSLDPAKHVSNLLGALRRLAEKT